MIYSRSNRRRSRYVAAFVAVAAASAITGCAVLGYVGTNLMPEKVKAAYEMEQRPTIVVVDDPSGFLDDRGLVHKIAHGIGRELIDHKALKQVLPGTALVQMAARLGDEYARLPIDQIGTTLGAQQVLHVNIESVNVSQMQVILECRAKVIDAQRGSRLFPPTGTGGPPASARNGGLVRAEWNYQPVTELGAGARAELNRDLARRVSVEVARLFYDHELPKRSEAFSPS